MSDEKNDLIEEVSDNLIETKRNSKDKILTIRLSEEDSDQVKILKCKPYYVNIAQYVRDCLTHLYQTRTNKAGRVK